MEYFVSDRIANLKPSAIREILKKIAENPSIIPLSTGSPASDAIPLKEIHEISDKIYSERGIMALSYNVTEGYAPLRETTAKRLREAFNIDCKASNILITTGGQQGLEMVPKVLCNEGDTAICELPSFVSGINAIKSVGANVVGVEMDDEGIKLDELEAAIKNNKNVRMLYLIPTFQNPSGKTMSLERRKAVYDLCVKNNIMILEDNPYGELRFTGEDIPTIKSMDTEGIVIYNGSYSKVLSAGMRIGFLCIPDALFPRLAVAEQVGTCHTNLFFQMVTDEFYRNYDIEGHIDRIREIYRRKCQLMLDTMDRCLDKRVTWTKPEGGLFLWCSLPEGYDSMKLADVALEKGVAFVPGCSFMVDDQAPCPAFRLNYSTPSDEAIVKGIEILGEAIDEFLK